MFVSCGRCRVVTACFVVRRRLKELTTSRSRLFVTVFVGLSAQRDPNVANSHVVQTYQYSGILLEDNFEIVFHGPPMMWMAGGGTTEENTRLGPETARGW